MYRMHGVFSITADIHVVDNIDSHGEVHYLSPKEGIYSVGNIVVH